MSTDVVSCVNKMATLHLTEHTSVINACRKFDGCCCFIYLTARLGFLYTLYECRAVVNVLEKLFRSHLRG